MIVFLGDDTKYGGGPGAFGRAKSLVFAVDQVGPDSFYICGLSAERARRQMYRTIIAGVGGCGLA
jgi:hypothetical protein